jgi:hypothetical protein
MSKHLSIFDQDDQFDPYSYSPDLFSANGVSDEVLFDLAIIYMQNNKMAELYFAITDIATNLSQYWICELNKCVTPAGTWTSITPIQCTRPGAMCTKISIEFGQLRLMHIVVDDIRGSMDEIIDDMLLLPDNTKHNNLIIMRFIKVIKDFNQIINTPVSDTMLKVRYYKDLIRRVEESRQYVLDSKIYCEKPVWVHNKKWKCPSFTITSITIFGGYVCAIIYNYFFI